MRFSICVPNYNDGPFIDRCFESIQRQTYKDFEVFFYDNYSTDDSFEIAKKYEKDSRFHILKADKHYRSAAHGLQEVFSKYATGEICTWINSDDYILDTYLSEINPLFNDPKVGFVRLPTYAYFAEDITDKGAIPLYNWNKLEDILKENKVYPGCPFRLEFFKEIGGIDEKIMFYDWDFWIRAALLGIRKGWKYLDYTKPLSVRMIHGDQTKQQLEEYLNEVKTKYDTVV